MPFANSWKCGATSADRSARGPSMPSPGPRLEPLASGSSRSERLLADFDRAWRDGLRPRIEDFLPPPGTAGFTPDDRLHLLSELVHIDLEGRWRLYQRQEVPNSGIQGRKWVGK